MEKLFVDDLFCMFLKIGGKLDSYANVVFSRVNIGKTDMHVTFLYFWNDCSMRILF